MIFAVAYFHLEIDSPSENGSYTRPLVRPLLLYPRTPPKSSLSPISTCIQLVLDAYACLGSRFFRNWVLNVMFYANRPFSCRRFVISIVQNMEWGLVIACSPYESALSPKGIAFSSKFQQYQCGFDGIQSCMSYPFQRSTMVEFLHLLTDEIQSVIA